MKPEPIHKLDTIRAMNSDWPTTDTTHKTRTLVFKILTTTNTIRRENCESSWVRV